MAEKLSYQGITRDDVRHFMEYVNKWSVRTAKSTEYISFQRKMEEALTPGNTRTVINYIIELERDRVALGKAEEHIRRLSRNCYNKCIYYDRRMGENKDPKGEMNYGNEN